MSADRILKRDAAYLVHCPKCRAEPSRACREKFASTLRTRPHPQRVDALDRALASAVAEVHAAVHLVTGSQS